ncbi:hypothetical protein [Microcoleus sp.]|uniref:hypothetical protein n=1 Tax=Microcoleus sp. TaxID=44472 RepID=UPI00403EE6AE
MRWEYRYLALDKSGSKAKGIVNILSFRARGQSQIADLLLVPLNSLQNEIKFEQEIEDEPEGN